MSKTMRVKIILIFFGLLDFINLYTLAVSDSSLSVILKGGFLAYHVIFYIGMFITVNDLLKMREYDNMKLKIALDMCADLIKERHNESEEKIMWIRTQDEEGLVNVAEVQLRNIDGIFVLFGFSISDGENGIILGKFDSKEKALKVLDDIQTQLKIGGWFCRIPSNEEVE